MTDNPLFQFLPILIFNHTGVKTEFCNFQYDIYTKIIMTYAEET